MEALEKEMELRCRTGNMDTGKSHRPDKYGAGIENMCHRHSVFAFLKRNHKV